MLKIFKEKEKENDGKEHYRKHFSQSVDHPRLFSFGRAAPLGRQFLGPAIDVFYFFYFFSHRYFSIFKFRSGVLTVEGSFGGGLGRCHCSSRDGGPFFPLE